VRVSSRAMNPLTHHDDPSATFCDSTQAKATTATQLFRSAEMLQALRDIVIPAYMQRRIRKGLDVWSAGCSSGEEVYSLAIVALHELEKLKEIPARVTVFGTDISDDQLRKAKAGQYLVNSSSGTLPAYKNILQKYAAIEGEFIQMNSLLREHVKFGKFDLRCRPRQHTFDFIVCNHVFQYYDDNAQINFVRNFIGVLNPGGLFFIEGLTARAQADAGLRKLPNTRSLFLPPE
jgi:chemotaxis methyl-accepting protein methylase